jgi:hypothetical protein
MEGRIPLVERDFHGGFKEGRCLRPSIAYEDVEDTKLGPDAIEQPSDLLGLGDVRLEYDPIGTGTSDASQRILGRLLVSIVVNADPHALRRELQHDASADAA